MTVMEDEKEEVTALAEVVREPPPADLIQPPRKLSEEEQRQEQLRSLEDEMLHNALNVVGGAIDFVALDGEEMPEGWREKYGDEGAERRLRAAIAGRENAKEAPIGIKVATQFAVGAIKARATERGGNRSLRVNVINFAAPRREYKELEVHEDEG